MLITLKGSTKVAPKGFSVVAEVEGLRLGPSRREEAAHLTRLTTSQLYAGNSATWNGKKYVWYICSVCLNTVHFQRNKNSKEDPQNLESTTLT